MDQIPDTRYFEVEIRDGAVVLKPLRTYSTSLEAIRSKVKDLFMVIIVLANQTIKQGGQYGSYRYPPNQNIELVETLLEIIKSSFSSPNVSCRKDQADSGCLSAHTDFIYRLNNLECNIAYICLLKL